MKVFFVLLCATEDGLQMCDTVKEELVLNDGVETKLTEKTHGKFSVLVEDEGTGAAHPENDFQNQIMLLQITVN